MQNLQPTVNVFCISNIKSRKSVLYIYHEAEARKSLNEICGFLLDYVEKYIRPDVIELRLFSDNCPGQNKNHCVTRMCLALTDTGFNSFSSFEVTHFFPVTVPLRSLKENCEDLTKIIITVSAQIQLITPHEIKMKSSTILFTALICQVVFGLVNTLMV